MSVSEEFEQAQSDVKNLAQRPGNDVLLKLYALYKQGSQGDAAGNRPGMFDLVGRANHSWGGYHWARTSNPFTVKLGDNVSSTWDSALSTASSDWSKSTVLDTTVVAG